MVTMPTINHNGTSLVELLEQYELAIAGLRSAISTLAAAAPNARDYQLGTPARSSGRRTNIVIASRGWRA